MTAQDFTVALFVRVDEALLDEKKHPLAKLYPSEVVTLGLLQALRGQGHRAFYRWVQKELGSLFPRLPERTRLLRLHYARTQGLDREANKAAILQVIEGNAAKGTRLAELMALLPTLTRAQVQYLLSELRNESQVVSQGKTNATLWFPARAE